MYSNVIPLQLHFTHFFTWDSWDLPTASKRHGRGTLDSAVNPPKGYLNVGKTTSYGDLMGFYGDLMVI